MEIIVEKILMLILIINEDYPPLQMEGLLANTWRAPEAGYLLVLNSFLGKPSNDNKPGESR